MALGHCELHYSGASGHKNSPKPRIVDSFSPFKARCHQAQACALLMHEPVLGFDTFGPFPWYAEQGYKHQLTPTLAWPFSHFRQFFIVFKGLCCLTWATRFRRISLSAWPLLTIILNGGCEFEMAWPDTASSVIYKMTPVWQPGICWKLGVKYELP